MGADKNVGENAVNSLVKEREENGPYESFIDFLSEMLVFIRNTCKSSLEGQAIQWTHRRGAV